MKLNEIKPNPDNPRILRDGKFAKLKQSLQDFPEMMDLRPIVVDENGIILGGNMRFRALQELYGKTGEIPDTWVKRADELTDEQKKEFIIKDNVSFGDWDFDALKGWDEPLDDWGVEIPEDFDVETEQTEAVEDDFDESEVKENICQSGDIWQLGENRLMCGDSTKVEDVEKLMNGEKADISFTSPPYNAGLTPTETKMNKTSKYLNDNDNKNQDEYFNFLSDFTKNSLSFSKYCFVNIQMLSNNKISFCEYLNEYKKELVDIIIWDKLTSQPAMAENVLNSEFEFVLCFGGNGSRSIGTKKFRGTLKNIVHISKQNKNTIKEHNATYPVEFVSHFINSFCNTEEIVLDLFGGSGTTLIACEQLNRKCYMMELDPHYCDVIIARWEKLTNKKAVKLQ